MLARLVFLASLALLTQTASAQQREWEDHDETVMYYEEAPMQANRLRWVSGSACPPDHDYCAMLEFCEDDSAWPDVIYGYRLPCVEEDESLCECKPGPGPTIRLEAGNKYYLTMRNAASSASSVTNLHTHGLHVVGSGDGDDVTRHVNGGGNCLDYSWDIAPDHPGGTSWYHAHHHGFTEAQVTGGAFGMVIVEDNPNITPDVPAWASNELLLQISRIAGSVYANGNTDETLSIDANQWYRLRTSIVDPLGESDYLTFGSGCEVHKVASDGIWRSRIPGPMKTKYLLTGSSRADFAIRCSTSFHVLYGGAKAATVYVGQVASNPHQMTDWTPARPPMFQGIATADVPDSNKFDVELTREGINNILWDPSEALTTIAYGEVHEWTLTRSKTHPFHMHLYHVMVVQPGGCGEQHEEGEFYDSVSGNEYEECKVRFRAADFGQRCVLHCHVLNHEDNGAMGWVDVQGPNMPRNDVSSPQYQCAAVPNTAAPTVATLAPTVSPTETPETAEPTEMPTAAPVEEDVVDIAEDEEKPPPEEDKPEDVDIPADDTPASPPSGASARGGSSVESFTRVLYGVVGLLCLML